VEDVLLQLVSLKFERGGYTGCYKREQISTTRVLWTFLALGTLLAIANFLISRAVEIKPPPTYRPFILPCPCEISHLCPIPIIKDEGSLTPKSPSLWSFFLHTSFWSGTGKASNELRAWLMGCQGTGCVSPSHPRPQTFCLD
jgi:hypothetical protein